MIYVFGMLGGFIASLLLFLLSRRRKPEWIIEDYTTGENHTQNWTKYNNIAWIVSNMVNLIIVVLFMITASVGIQETLPYSMITTVLTYMFIQSVYTDNSFRKVDRMSLYLSCLIAFSGNLLFVFYNPVNIAFWVITMIVSFSLVMFPIMGASDGRAILLLSIALVPLTSVGYFFLSIILFIVLSLLFVIFEILRNTRKLGFSDSLKNSGKSIPAVPLILFPALAIVFDRFFPWVNYLNTDFFWFL